MKNYTTDIYHLVDESFISRFDSLQSSFMKNYYYDFYKLYCIQNKRSPLSENDFFNNMRRRKIKLVQVCCPYCGNMKLFIIKGTLSDVSNLNYCTKCGKHSAAENAFFQFSRFIRIQQFHLSGLRKLKENHDINELKIMSYDIYQLELIALTSIVEVLLRDFFDSFVYLKYKNSRTPYLDSIIHKNTGNDFMKIDKANIHYKKALDIDLHIHITKECWDSLVDLVQIRNTLVHNNGLIDKKFRTSKTFFRIRNLIKGDLIFIDEQIINRYQKYVVELLSAITNLFNTQYQKQLHNLVSNYYFNSKPEMESEGRWISLIDAIMSRTKENV